jgi:hypothetical protein
MAQIGAMSAIQTVTVPDTHIPGIYTTGMGITGSFVLADPLAPNLSNADIYDNLLWFSFYDGRGTVNQADIQTPAQAFLPPFPKFVIFTDAFGNIIDWDIDLPTPYPQLSGFSPDGSYHPNTEPGMQQYYIHTSLALDLAQIAQCASSNHVTENCDNFYDVASVTNDPGIWVEGTPIPEPGTLFLFGAGLIELAALGRIIAPPMNHRLENSVPPVRQAAPPINSAFLSIAVCLWRCIARSRASDTAAASGPRGRP